jgi:hypothetical protein
MCLFIFFSSLLNSLGDITKTSFSSFSFRFRLCFFAPTTFRHYQHDEEHRSRHSAHDESHGGAGWHVCEREYLVE